MYNTIIIGAGPVGSYLATKLTEHGQKVIVLDKKAAAGQDICCTGIISQECYNLLSLNEDIAVRQANSAKFLISSGREIRIWRGDDVALIIDRTSLEEALARKARSIGTEYHFATKVTDIEFDRNCLVIKANSYGGQKVFESETAVIATGYGSKLTRNLGFGTIGHFTLGAQAEVTINNIHEIEIYFDQEVSPGGFAWLVPTRDGRGLAGLMTRHQPKGHLNQFLLNLRNQGKISSIEVAKNYAAIPLHPLPKTYTDRILVVGEAAGQVKPMTGGGIYYGIICADIAANVLYQALKSGDLSASKLSTYQKQWHSKLLRELTIGYWAQRLWGKLSNKQIEYLSNIAKRKHIPELIATTKQFPFDWHSRLLLQIAYSLLPFVNPRKQL